MRIVPTVIACIGIALSSYATDHLSTKNFKSAGVLPVIIKNNKKYAIIGHEAMGNSQGSYSDWGGEREEDESSPRVTAAREFYEEAIIRKTLDKKLSDVEQYLEPKSPFLEYHLIVQRHGNYEHTFIVQIPEKEGEQLLTHFMPIRKHKFRNYQHSQHKLDTTEKEKNRIALVDWEELERGILNKAHMVQATEYLADGKKRPVMIWLRSSFVKRMRPFFNNDAYRENKAQKIRFYMEVL